MKPNLIIYSTSFWVACLDWIEWDTDLGIGGVIWSSGIDFFIKKKNLLLVRVALDQILDTDLICSKCSKQVITLENLKLFNSIFLLGGEKALRNCLENFK